MGEKIILNKGGGGSAETVTMTISLTASNGVDPFGQTVTITEIGTGEVFTTIQYLGPVAHKLTVSVPVHLYYRVSVDNIKGYQTPDAVEGTVRKDTPIEITFQYLLGTRYGYRRTIATADPYTRIEYLYDAEGKTPFTMDFAAGTPNYGDWEAFINEVATPVMLRYDGTEDYELDRNDQTKRADGAASSITNTAYEGNAMVRFGGKWKWVHRSEDETYQYVIFSDIQYDDTYHAYAHTDENGNIQDRFYWGMYKGSYSGSRLRSLAGQAVMVKQSRYAEVERAVANGSGWDTIYKSAWDYIWDMLILISKNDNAQAVFGYGRCKSNNGAGISTGSTISHGGFWGSTDQTSDVKVFWIEGFWGNYFESMRGMVFYDNEIRTKMTPPYNFDGSDYHGTGITPSGDSGGFIETASVTDEDGFVPKTATGTGAGDTFYCDSFSYNNKQNSYVFVGGSWYYGTRCGRSLFLGYAPSVTDAEIGSRLSYIPQNVLSIA